MIRLDARLRLAVALAVACTSCATEDISPLPEVRTHEIANIPPAWCIPPPEPGVLEAPVDPGGCLKPEGVLQSVPIQLLVDHEGRFKDIVSFNSPCAGDEHDVPVAVRGCIERALKTWRWEIYDAGCPGRTDDQMVWMGATNSLRRHPAAVVSGSDVVARLPPFAAIGACGA